jgi:hypothetical protein
VMNQHSAHGECAQAIQLGHIIGSVILSLELSHQALTGMGQKEISYRRQYPAVNALSFS